MLETACSHQVSAPEIAAPEISSSQGLHKVSSQQIRPEISGVELGTQ